MEWNMNYTHFKLKLKTFKNSSLLLMMRCHHNASSETPLLLSKDWKKNTKTVNFISRSDSFKSLNDTSQWIFYYFWNEWLTHDSWSGITNLFVSKAYHWSFFTNKLNCDDVSRARFNSFSFFFFCYFVFCSIDNKFCELKAK
jgi:hypothetical protein